ncbi:hypothetical protein [Rufibacter psychrotolerans]|uniref:hypothetical protein n=1 Tax=Rufibacter psychrotolerans TaxID=2812556 RepID=UPI0019678CC8|nr:hypothetical protein [Rufibacter sp. SYSU D00308]
MKKVFYLFFSMMAVLVSACDPLEDTYKELDEARGATNVRDLAITLTNANYQSLKDKPGVPSYVNTSFYFISEEQAGELIPLYLDATYPHLDERSSVAVTYNQLVFDYTNNNVATTAATETSPATPLPIYTLTDEDYTNIGVSNTRLNISNNDGDVIKFLNYKYPAPVENQLVVFTFNAYNSRVSGTAAVTTDSYYYKNGAWRNAYHVTPADYTAVNRGRYNNFEAIDNELLPAYFDRFLSNAITGAKVNDVQYVSYNYFASGSNSQRIMTMAFNGTNWYELKQDIVRPVTLLFAKKNGKFVPDLTIKYTLVQADYETIAGFTNVGTESNRANLKQFRNFYQAGSSTDGRYWTDAQIKAGLAELLKVKFPNAEVGQKYQLSYIVYRGSNTTVLTTFEKKASGNYEEVK